jgi:hypothetical protein
VFVSGCRRPANARRRRGEAAAGSPRREPGAGPGVLHGEAGAAVPLPDRAASVPAAGPPAAAAPAVDAAAAAGWAHGRPAGSGARAGRRTGRGRRRLVLHLLTMRATRRRGDVCGGSFCSLGSSYFFLFIRQHVHVQKMRRGL